MARRLGFAGAVALVCFLLLEGGVRAVLALRVGPSVLLYGFAPDRDDQRVGLHENQGVGYSKYFAHQERRDRDADTGEVFAVGINARGFRGPDFAQEKPPGTTRVVALGASSTFGYHARDHETYPRRLQQILNQRCPQRGPFEVINLGIPHLDSAEILALFMAEAVPLAPDYATFYEGVNDSTGLWERAGVRPRLNRTGLLRDVLRAARDRLLVVSLLDSVLSPKRRINSEAMVAEHLEGRSDRFLSNLTRLHEECRKRGVTLVVASQQAKSTLFDREAIRGVPYWREVEFVRARLAAERRLGDADLVFLTQSVLMRDLAEWARRREVLYVDAIAALDGRRDALVSIVHLTAAGNRALAEAFARRILEHACPDSASGPLPAMEASRSD